MSELADDNYSLLERLVSSDAIVSNFVILYPAWLVTTSIILFFTLFAGPSYKVYQDLAYPGMGLQLILLVILIFARRKYKHNFSTLRRYIRRRLSATGLKSKSHIILKQFLPRLKSIFLIRFVFLNLFCVVLYGIGFLIPNNIYPLVLIPGVLLILTYSSKYSMIDPDLIISTSSFWE